MMVGTINCLIFLTLSPKRASFCKKTKNLINHYQNKVVQLLFFIKSPLYLQ